MTKPMKIENPKTNKFLVEFKSTNCMLDKPTALIKPNITQKTPPTIGCGMVRKNAPNFETSPKSSMINAPYWITLLLPTLVTPMAAIGSRKKSLL